MGLDQTSGKIAQPVFGKIALPWFVRTALKITHKNLFFTAMTPSS